MVLALARYSQSDIEAILKILNTCPGGQENKAIRIAVIATRVMADERFGVDEMRRYIRFLDESVPGHEEAPVAPLIEEALFPCDLRPKNIRARMKRLNKASMEIGEKNSMIPPDTRPWDLDATAAISLIGFARKIVGSGDEKEFETAVSAAEVASRMANEAIDFLDSPENFRKAFLQEIGDLRGALASCRNSENREVPLPSLGIRFEASPMVKASIEAALRNLAKSPVITLLGTGEAGSGSLRSGSAEDCREEIEEPEEEMSL